MNVILWTESSKVNENTRAVQLHELIMSDGDSAVCVLIPDGVIDVDLFMYRLNQAIATLKLGALKRA